MLTALLSYWIMIGSQALTRHVLFTCVLFHLLSIAAFRVFFWRVSGARRAFEGVEQMKKLKEGLSSSFTKPDQPNASQDSHRKTIRFQFLIFFFYLTEKGY